MKVNIKSSKLQKVHWEMDMSEGYNLIDYSTNMSVSSTIPMYSSVNKKETSLVSLFISESEKVIQQSKAGPKTNENSRTALRSFQKFLGKKDIAIACLSNEKIKKYEQWLIYSEGVSPNTSALYMRSLRALYNKVIRGKKNKNIFANVRTKPMTSTRIVAVSLNTIKTIASLHSSDDTLQLARDIFMFSFYCMGMPFIDIFSLQRHQIDRGELKYHRHKTGTEVVVELPKEAMVILDRYQQKDSPFVFPFTINLKRRKYATVLHMYNKYLSLLENHLHLSVHLTSYVARHTWATLAYNETCDMNIIAEALGHTSTRITRTYVTYMHNKKLYAINKKILRMIETKRN